MDTYVSEKTRQNIERALLYIDENLDKKLTVVDVANHAYVSRFHFQRLFSAYMGETVNQYVFHRRLEFAAEKMIHNKSIALADLAIETGFGTHSAFSRAFKKQFGVTPSEFREKPNQISLSHDNLRPFLNTVTPKKLTLEVSVKELSTLWFNYKIAKVDTDTTNFDFHDSVKQIATDFNGFMDIGKPHLFGVTTMRASGQNVRVESFNDMLYGGIYTKKSDDDWSPDWFEIDAGLWAVCIYKGNYEYSYQTWNNLLRAWLPESGYELRDTLAFERYLNSPVVESTTETWLTQIHLPIKKAQMG